VNMVYTLYVYDDLAAYQKSTMTRQKDADYQRVTAKLNTMRSRQTNTFLEPNPWSPMK
jgi:hypothetical protein